MIQLRKENIGLIYNDFKAIDIDDPSIFAFKRVKSAETKEYLILLNFSENVVSREYDGLGAYKVFFSNYNDHKIESDMITFNPYEGIILKK